MAEGASDPRLVIFDLDGTLVVSFGETPLAGVLDQLAALSADGTHLAVATNQAGPAWRLATGAAKYPDPTRLGARLARIATSLPPLLTVPWFVAIGDHRVTLAPDDYGRLGDALTRAAGVLDLRANEDAGWRKPAPGMLYAACVHYGVPVDAVVYVGDSETDALAARHAGMAFVFADDYFAR